MLNSSSSTTSESTYIVDIVLDLPAIKVFNIHQSKHSLEPETATFETLWPVIHVGNKRQQLNTL